MSLLKTTLVAAAFSIAATAAYADSRVPVQDASVPHQHSRTWSNARAAYASTQNVKHARHNRTQSQDDVLFTREYMDQHSGH